METIIRKLSESEASVNNPVITEAANIIRSGGLVAFPTETVYGLGCNALDNSAAMKIYGAKGRPSDNPLIVHVANKSQVYSVADYVPPVADMIFSLFSPGPVTLILKKKECLPDETTGGLKTVAVRIPRNDTALALIQAAGVPIAAPSANISGRPSPTRAVHVREDLYGKIDMIIDGGYSKVGLESTIIDVSCEPPVLLRPGAVVLEELSDLGIIPENPSDKSARPIAPGMKYRHYAPNAKISIVNDVDELVRLASRCAGAGVRTAVVTAEELLPHVEGAVSLNLGSMVHPNRIATHLFYLLRELDHMEIEQAYVLALPEVGIMAAVMNRLRKAAGVRQ
jgi:L-threonylcarbamoyladenylate synthase